MKIKSNIPISNNADINTILADSTVSAMLTEQEAIQHIKQLTRVTEFQFQFIVNTSSFNIPQDRLYIMYYVDIYGTVNYTVKTQNPLVEYITDEALTSWPDSIDQLLNHLLSLAKELLTN